MPQWLFHFIGADGGPWSYWWGGLASILLPWGGAYVLYRWHNNCHHTGCWRVGKHPIKDTPYVACKVHHPDIDHTKPVDLTSVAQGPSA